MLALPDIPERGLGSCAVVGNSDNLLGAGRGPQIDDHDTVLRHNTPMRGFETDVGSRRSVVYMKSKYSKAPPKGTSLRGQERVRYSVPSTHPLLRWSGHRA